MKNVPEVIYLQVGEDCPDDVDFQELHEVTWCAGRQFSSDIPFVLQKTDCSTQLPLTDYDLERLYEWIMDDNRKRSITAFTSGAARNIASAIELKFQRQLR